MSPSEHLGWWQGRRLRRASWMDVVTLACLAGLATMVLVCGRQARLVLKPRSAVENAALLDELELPARLPNAPVADATGSRAPIFDRMKQARAVVAFYAPWCGPCQKELPTLSRLLATRVDIFVVVSADEDLEATRRQLANLGLLDLSFFVDDTQRLAREGRVTALPTTFLVSRQGAVLERTRGYSMIDLMRLKQRVDPDDTSFAMPEAE